MEQEGEEFPLRFFWGQIRAGALEIEEQIIALMLAKMPDMQLWRSARFFSFPFVRRQLCDIPH